MAHVYKLSALPSSPLSPSWGHLPLMLRPWVACEPTCPLTLTYPFNLWPDCPVLKRSDMPCFFWQTQFSNLNSSVLSFSLWLSTCHLVALHFVTFLEQAMCFQDSVLWFTMFFLWNAFSPILFILKCYYLFKSKFKYLLCKGCSNPVRQNKSRLLKEIIHYLRMTFVIVLSFLDLYYTYLFLSLENKLL